MISVENLTKRYAGFTAVDNITFDCAPGRVTGFLGPNGAGKSTALRMISGLTPPTSGTATLGGVPFKSIPNPGTQVGVLLDASAQHAGRTGREILKIGAATMGLPSRRVDEMLDLVGLTKKESKRRVRNYSLGMRQRLGIAHAMLGDPRIMLLDEPANGLDPAGIRWMRDLMRYYAESGGTVLLSSHLLHEIEVIADDIIVIGNGKIMRQMRKDELLKSAGTLVRAINPAAFTETMKQAGIAVDQAPDGSWLTKSSPEDVGRAAAGGQIVLTELRPAPAPTLEDLFLDLTSGEQRDGDVAQRAQLGEGGAA